MCMYFLVFIRILKFKNESNLTQNNMLRTKLLHGIHTVKNNKIILLYLFEIAVYFENYFGIFK